MSHNTSANQQQGAPAAPELAVDDVDNPQRRAALRQLGGFAAYTAPTLLMLLSPRSTQAGSIPDLPPDRPNGSGMTGF